MGCTPCNEVSSLTLKLSLCDPIHIIVVVVFYLLKYLTFVNDYENFRKAKVLLI